ncbi:hypothetical protein [Bradyrhizobium brasilense]|uniref:hypothetical protein n=1 Tax=Bradyrhizobium brasilense TaxID=1419277 RepID=UPI001E4181D5|nr:hypothetical protein [Bradyrhizobium brasilense]MCC8968968.1 hypothetical protein [Bradyrhizobium brasilense]
MDDENGISLRGHDRSDLDVCAPSAAVAERGILLGELLETLPARSFAQIAKRRQSQPFFRDGRAQAP